MPVTLEYVIGISIPLVLIAVSGHIIWRSTSSFELAADYLGRKMSRGVKGATINAVASSMPEFLTTMFFVFIVRNEGEFVDSFSGGLGVVAGSAIFNILIIPLAVIFFGVAGLKSSSFRLDKKSIRRDGIFLLLSNVILIIVISQQTLTYIHGIILISVYLAYLFLLRKGMGFRASEHPEQKEFRVDKINRPWFLSILRVDVKHLLLNGKKLNRGNAWWTMFVSIVVMSIGTWMLVTGTEMLGHEEYEFFGMGGLRGLGLPVIYLSVLLAAAATSIPDTMISVRDARKGNHDDAISNALGSNIFDISFALGLPLLLFTILYNDLEMSRHIRILTITSWLLMWVINLAVVPVFILSKRINRRVGLLLLVLYIAFIVIITEESTQNGIIGGYIGEFLDFMNR